MTTQTYATQPTQYYLDAIAAQQAGGSAVNFVTGTLVVGDGNGVVPALASLIAANGVTHEVWRGQVITSVTVDPNNAAQLDIGVDIPATINGVEVGPFNITEFAILDATGHCCIVGTTNLQKTVSAQGQVSDLAWTAAVGVGVGSVTLMPPTGSFVTLSQVIAAYNANLPDCVAPLNKTDTTGPTGWLRRVFGVNKASKPADATTTADAAAMGVGRPATDAEFTAGAGEIGGFAWPWPTLQQIAVALASVESWVAGQLGAFLPLSGGALTGFLTLNADPTAPKHAATKEYVDGAVAGLAAAGERTGYLSVNDATNPDTVRNITASAFVVANAAGQTMTLTNVAVSVNSALSGAGGLDAGALQAGASYHTHIIAGAGEPTRAILSLSATAPTLPAGYTFWARGDGAAITDATGKFYRVRFVDRRGQFVVTAGTNTAVLPVIAQGKYGTLSMSGNQWTSSTSVAFPIGGFFPSTALEITMSLANAYLANGGHAMGFVAPSAAYGQNGAVPPAWVGIEGSQADIKTVSFMPESSSVWIASNAVSGQNNFAVSALGWTEGK
jgi:hypothetical protein